MLTNKNECNIIYLQKITNERGEIVEEKKVTKISLSTFFLILAIIAICVMGYFIYKLNDDKENANSKITELNNKISSSQSTIDNLNTTEKNTTSITTNTNNKTNESVINDNNLIGTEIKEKLSDTKGNDLYKKAIFSKPFLSLLIENKDSLKVEFSDEEIMKLLVEIDKEKDKSGLFTDTSNSNGFYVSANIDDVQKLAQKYFGRTLNIDQLKGKNGNQVVVEVPSGFGIIVDKFVAGYEMNNGDYFLTLEQIDEESSGNLTYGLFIKYDDTTGSITYKGFTSDIITYVSKYNSKNAN